MNVTMGSVGYLLIMCGHEHSKRNVNILTLLFCIATNTILIPLYGIEGAAMATALTLTANNLIATLLVKRYLGFIPMSLFR